MQPKNKHLLTSAALFGFPAGLAIIGLVIAQILLTDGGDSGSTRFVGFIIMLLAFSLIFFGIKHHRAHVPEPTPAFSRSLLLGTLIAFCAGTAYALVWELYLYLNDYAFIEQYISNLTEAKKARFTGAELETELAKVGDLRRFYFNPVQRIPTTLNEIFPLGMVVAVLCSVYFQIAAYFQRTR